MSTTSPNAATAAAPAGASSSVSSPRFNSSTGQHPVAGGDKESTVIDDRRSEVSGAGYSAYSGHRASESAEAPNYHIRLIKFYQRYNPEKIPRAHEFLEAYKGDEEELFRTLVAKYGPEPEPSVISVASGSTGFASGQRVGLAHVPKIVSREDGNCDRETPYFPAQRSIMESDLCNLLVTKQTTHVDLKQIYVGYLGAHPASAWNGMTYVTNVPVPIDENSRFLGHLWSGSLSNTKTIVHDKLSYTRTVFHCGESCSNPDNPHERWRLTLIRGDHTADTLYRVLWDPFLSPQAAAELLNKAPSAVSEDRSFFGSLFGRNKKPDKATALPPPPPPPPPRAGGFASHHSNNPAQRSSSSAQNHLHSGSSAGGGGAGAGSGGAGAPPPPAYPPPVNPAQPPMPLQPTGGKAVAGGAAAHPTATAAATATPGAGAAAVVAGAGAAAAAAASAGATAPGFHQPQQPQVVSAIDSLVQLVQGLEGRLTERLSDLDKRLQAVENDVVLLKEVSDQRQVEQLPEPWLQDGGGSSAVGPAAARPGSRNHAGGGHSRSSAARSSGRDSGQQQQPRSDRERAQLQAKARRRQHRRRLEEARDRGYNEQDDDGTETIRTATSLGTSIGARSSDYG